MLKKDGALVKNDSKFDDASVGQEMLFPKSSETELRKTKIKKLDIDQKITTYRPSLYNYNWIVTRSNSDVFSTHTTTTLRPKIQYKIKTTPKTIIIRRKNNTQKLLISKANGNLPNNSFEYRLTFDNNKRGAKRYTSTPISVK